MNFKLSDVRVEKTVMRGTALGGVTREGLVTRILRGSGFEVNDGIHQQSILVRDCRILTGEEAATINAMYSAAVGRVLRTDSNLKPQQPLYGVVDHEWWERQTIPVCRPDGTVEAEGVEPAFAVFAEGTAVADIAVVLDHERQPWGPECAAERAWQRQMAILRDGDLSPRSPLAPHRSPPLGEGGQNLPAALGGPPLRPVTPPMSATRTLTPQRPAQLDAASQAPPPAPTRPAPNPPAFERPHPLNLEGLLASAVEDDEHRLHAPRSQNGVRTSQLSCEGPRAGDKQTVTPTYSVSDDEAESEIDTTPLREAPPLPDDEETPTNEISITFKGSISVPVWILCAVGGVALVYLWMVAAFVSRLTFRAP